MNFLIDTTYINEKCEPVVNDRKTREHIADRLLTAMRGNGIIFATSNMVGMKHRAIALRGIDGVIFNPEITFGDHDVKLPETAVSLPFKMTGNVKRYSRVRLKYEDVDGGLNSMIYSGLTAKSVQQAIDLLEGKDCWELMSKEKIDIVRRKLAKLKRKRINAIRN